jgi:BirA family biotin operon repressor/biotin-[acetyl-CoA-carboxylase] ligase
LPDPSQTPIGTPFIELQSVDSTNNYALERLRAGLASHGTAFFAHEQVAGKGQRGKIWTAEKDKSLVLSVVIDPRPLTLSRQFQLSACVSISVWELFQSYTRDDAVSIKWPNDLYWQDKKAGGILIENIVGGLQPADDSGLSAGWQWAVTGMGININQTSFPELPNAVSLSQITGKQFHTIDLARELCQILQNNFALLAREGFDKTYRTYISRLYKKDQPVRFKKGSRSFEAVVKTVSPEGRLVVQHAMEEEFTLGEVEWVL